MTQTTRRSFTRFTLALPVLSVLPRVAAAADEPVRIGATYPFTGVAASAGTALREAVEVALDIVNNPHPELGELPLGPTAGLPNLGGRKVEASFADHQGNPATAQNQTLRLISQDRVVAMVGSYQSSCTLTSSQVAERYGIPFVAGEASAPSLTQRGFKWFFRPTPIGTDFGRAYADFLSGLKGRGIKADKIAMVNENTEYGTSTGDAIIKALKDKGLNLGLRIPYAANSADVSAQVLQLKSEGPDAVIFVSYTSDSILFVKTMRSLDYKPAIVIGDEFGLFRYVVHSGGRRSGGGRHQPQLVRCRQAGRNQLQGERDLPEEGRPRSRRHERARDAGLPRAMRRDQPRRLDRAGKDPGCPEGDRP